MAENKQALKETSQQLLDAADAKNEQSASQLHQEQKLRKESDLSFHIDGENDHEDPEDGLKTPLKKRYNHKNNDENYENRGDSSDSFSNVISLSDQGSLGSATTTAAMFYRRDRKGLAYMALASLSLAIGALLIRKLENNKIMVVELMFYRSSFTIGFLFIFHILKRKHENKSKNNESNSNNGGNSNHKQQHNAQEMKEIKNNFTSPLPAAEKHGDNAQYTSPPYFNSSSPDNIKKGNVQDSNNNDNNNHLLEHIEGFRNENQDHILESATKTANETHAITYVDQKQKRFVQIYAILNSLVVYAYFYGIQQLPVFEAISLQNCSLLFTGIVNCLVLMRKQQPDTSRKTNKLGKNQVILSVLFVVGIYLIAHDNELIPVLVCLILGSGVQYLIQMSIQTYQASTPHLTLLFYSSFVQLIIAPCLVALSESSFSVLSYEDGGLICLMAFLQIAGMKCLHKSFLSFSKGHHFNFNAQLAIVFTVILGYWFLDDLLHWRPLLGAALIIISTVVLSFKIRS